MIVKHTQLFASGHDMLAVLAKLLSQKTDHTAQTCQKQSLSVVALQHSWSGARHTMPSGAVLWQHCYVSLLSALMPL